LKLALGDDGVECLLPVPDLDPMHEDLKHLIDCEDLAGGEGSDVPADGKSGGAYARFDGLVQTQILLVPIVVAETADDVRLVLAELGQFVLRVCGEINDVLSRIGFVIPQPIVGVFPPFCICPSLIPGIVHGMETSKSTAVQGRVDESEGVRSATIGAVGVGELRTKRGDFLAVDVRQ